MCWFCLLGLVCLSWMSYQCALLCLASSLSMSLHASTIWRIISLCPKGQVSIMLGMFLKYNGLCYFAFWKPNLHATAPDTCARLGGSWDWQPETEHHAPHCPHMMSAGFVFQQNGPWTKFWIMVLSHSSATTFNPKTLYIKILSEMIPEHQIGKNILGN